MELKIQTTGSGDYGPHLKALIVGPAKSGKSQPINTPTPTPNGFVPMGDLKIGDLVFSQSAVPTAVTGVYPQGELETYRVDFSDGSHAFCNDEHLWDVERKVHRNNGDEPETKDWERFTLTLREIVDSGLTRGKASTDWKFRIPLCEPIQYPHKNLPVEPYTLGVLIADGGLTNDSVVFTTNNQEVVDRVALSHEVTERNVDTTKYARRFSLNGMKPTMKALGLDAKRSADKFIPSDYLTGSVHQRVALLHGLMDCDGGNHLAANNGRSVHYTSTSNQLISDVVSLVNSLGGTGKPSICKHPKGDYFKVSIMMPAGFESFSTSGKLVEKISKSKRTPIRAIVGVESVGLTEQVCIQVDNEEHLYLSGHNYTVTHNTLIGSCFPDPFYISAEGGLMSIAHKGIPYSEVTNSSEIDLIIKALSQSPDKVEESFGMMPKTIVVDTIDEIQEFVINEILAEEGREAMIQKDWGTLYSRMKNMIRQIRNLPYHVVMLGHIKTMSDEASGRTWNDLAVSGKMSSKLTEMFDIIGALTSVKVTNNSGGTMTQEVQRQLLTAPSPAYAFLGDRSGQLDSPMVIDFTNEFERIHSAIFGREGLPESTVISTLTGVASQAGKPSAAKGAKLQEPPKGKSEAMKASLEALKSNADKKVADKSASK